MYPPMNLRGYTSDLYLFITYKKYKDNFCPTMWTKSLNQKLSCDTVLKFLIFKFRQEQLVLILIIIQAQKTRVIVWKVVKQSRIYQSLSRQALTSLVSFNFSADFLFLEGHEDNVTSNKVFSVIEERRRTIPGIPLFSSVKWTYADIWVDLMPLV